MKAAAISSCCLFLAPVTRSLFTSTNCFQFLETSTH